MNDYMLTLYASAIPFILIYLMPSLMSLVQSNKTAVVTALCPETDALEEQRAICHQLVS